jgi:hypothetical protein
VGLLRASSEEVGQDVALAATIGGAGAERIPHGAALVRFGEAVTRGTEDLPAARSTLREALGEEGFAEAAGIAAIFNGLVRTADLSGIPLDDDTLHGSADFREALGLDRFGGAANTALDRADPARAPKRFFDIPAR